MFFYKFAILLISDKFTKKGENNKSSEIQLQKEKGLSTCKNNTNSTGIGSWTIPERSWEKQILLFPRLFYYRIGKECPICGQEENVEDFLEAYVPEDDGQYLYDLAKKSQNLIEDIGKNLYKK